MPWSRDTIARRYALTIVVAIMVAVGLTKLVGQAAGVWGDPPVRETGLLERGADIVRMLEAVPPAQRQAVADAVANATFRVDWYPASSAIAMALNGPRESQTLGRHFKTLPNLSEFDVGGRPRRLAYFDFHGQPPPGLRRDVGDHASAYLFSVELGDASSAVFVVPTRVWGLSEPLRIGVGLFFLVVSVAAVSALATYRLSRPISEFTEALRRFGTDPRAAPIPPSGPCELRESIAAFNAMQAQIQTFVSDRTAMLAAISHDLRTPLTKMRLRGELIEDEEQRARLFRDVDDMREMVESALAFFRDDYQGEETTAFDFPQLLRTIADDYGDQGHEIPYEGAEHFVFQGRPFALKRAFANLVDNAVKYGAAPRIELLCSPQRIVVAVRDSGPGIPQAATELVFAPFHRLERSRNRATGGVGLGLTSARAVILGHGGAISLRNRPSGGLEVEVVLPIRV